MTKCKIHGATDGLDQMLTWDKVNFWTPEGSGIPDDNIVSLNVSVEAGDAVYVKIEYRNEDFEIIEKVFLVQQLGIEFNAHECGEVEES